VRSQSGTKIGDLPYRCRFTGKKGTGTPPGGEVEKEEEIRISEEKNVLVEKEGQPGHNPKGGGDMFSRLLTGEKTELRN